MGLSGLTSGMASGMASGLGDRAQLAASMRHNADLRGHIARLSQEAATGVAADMAAHLGGDTGPLADLDRRLALAGDFGRAAREVDSRLATMQVALDDVEGARAGLLDRLMASNMPANAGARTVAADAAAEAFGRVVGALNARMGESALFAGAADDRAALAPAATMLAAVRAAGAGATTAAGVAAAVDAWFDDPMGGFATTGYLGASQDMVRPVDADEAVTLGARADDPSLRGLLKAAALAALAADPALPLADVEARGLMARARDDLLGLAAPLTDLRGGLGAAQARAEEAVARHAARASAWGILRAETTQLDPYATASELQAVQAQLETHYALTSRLSQLNLATVLR